MRRQPGSATALCDRLVDAGVAFLAAWTLAYHLCVTLRLGVPWAWATTGVLLAGWLLLDRRLRSASDPDGESAGPAVGSLKDPFAILAAVAAVVTAVGMATRAPWTVVWVGWLVASGAGIVTAWRWLRPAPSPEHTEPDTAERETAGAGETPVELALVLGWGIAMAVVALWTMNPNGDDLFYVNLAEWVATHGEFPIRDTLFADLTYPMANWPPVASYDPLVGAVAALAGVRAATIAYVVVPPLASFLGVLMLWRLLRAWQVRPAVVALSVALLSLLVAHGSGVTPGEGMLNRIWQGKFLLVWLAIPWLLARLVRYAERPGKRQALWLVIGSVAAVGLSTTAIFVVPLIALAGAAPVLRTSWRAALGCLVATAAYPLGAGIVTTLLHGRSADLFETRKLGRFAPDQIAHSLFRVDTIAFAMVLVVLLGALMIPQPSARLTGGVLALALGVVFIPGVTELSYDLIGLGPTLRRIRHTLVIVALVGVVVVRLGSAIPGRRAVALGCAMLAATLFFWQFGAPVRTSSASWWQQPLHWQRTDADRVATARILAAAPSDRLVLAPSGLAVTIAVTTTSVKTVTPRGYYMDYLRDDPTFHYDARNVLFRFASNPGRWDPLRQPQLDQALAQVDVAIACVHRRATDRARGLRAAGMADFFTTPYYRCFRNH